MKTSKIILLLTALSLLSFQGFTQNWQLVWQDEFNGSISNDWVFETGAGGWGNNELQYYRRENASVQNGQLVISAKREAFGGANYTSVRMKTQGKKSWKYGKIEARIAMPSFSGIWPAFWMLGDNISSVGWPSCGEIDIMEHVNAGSTVYGTIHWADNSNAHAEYSGNTTTSALTAYHTYTVEWNASSIKWFVDGNKYHEANIANGVNGTSELHNNFFILLNMAVGGNWPGFNIDNGQFPANMYVDYVRVYQDNGNPVNPQPGGVATVYKDCNYGGYAIGLPAGDYNYGALYAKGVGNEDISSLKVNSGYEIQLFEHDNFTGSSITFGGDNSCLVASGWNDRTTSLKIRAVSSAFTKTIQAESYSAMAGVQVETTTDAGGGQNVGYIDNNDWMAYNSINFPTSGTYKVEYRVASLNGGNRLSLDLNAGTIQLGAVNIPSTGGWQNWTTVSHTVNINAGTYNVGVFAAIGGFNLNWIRFTKVSARMDSDLAEEASAPAQEAAAFYPNPTSGDLTISLAGGVESGSASISDMYGNLVKTVSLTSITTVDVADLATGVYILSVTSEAGTTTKRFLKK